MACNACAKRRQKIREIAKMAIRKARPVARLVTSWRRPKA